MPADWLCEFVCGIPDDREMEEKSTDDTTSKSTSLSEISRFSKFECIKGKQSITKGLIWEFHTLQPSRPSLRFSNWRAYRTSRNELTK